MNKTVNKDIMQGRIKAVLASHYSTVPVERLNEEINKRIKETLNKLKK